MDSQIEVMIAGFHQLLLALTFVLIPAVALKYGQRAQVAAEKSVSRQGLDSKLLIQNGIKFSESKVEALLPLVFVVTYTTAALLIFTGNELGKTLTWITELITLLIVGMVTANQVFAVSFMKRAFKKSRNAELQKIDVEGFVTAALKEFPIWLRPLQIIRFVLATVGAVIVLVLLMI